MFEMGNRWGQAKEDGEEGGGGGQYTVNQGPEWTGIAPDAKEGFQVSKKGFRDGAGMSKQGGCQRDWVMHSELC